MNYIEAVKKMVDDPDCFMTRGDGKTLYRMMGFLSYSNEENYWIPEQRAWAVDALATDWRVVIRD